MVNVDIMGVPAGGMRTHSMRACWQSEQTVIFCDNVGAVSGSPHVLRAYRHGGEESQRDYAAASCFMIRPRYGSWEP